MSTIVELVSYGRTHVTVVELVPLILKHYLLKEAVVSGNSMFGLQIGDSEN